MVYRVLVYLGTGSTLVPFSFGMREAGWKDCMLLFIGSRRAIRVSGDSMRPTLENDDVVLVAPARDLAVGDIVLAAHPFRSSVTLLKRIVSFDEAERVELRGDDPDSSSDSRGFGSIPMENIRGKVICRLRRVENGQKN